MGRHSVAQEDGLRDGLKQRASTAAATAAASSESDAALDGDGEALAWCAELDNGGDPGCDFTAILTTEDDPSGAMAHHQTVRVRPSSVTEIELSACVALDAPPDLCGNADGISLANPCGGGPCGDVAESDDDEQPGNRPDDISDDENDIYVNVSFSEESPDAEPAEAAEATAVRPRFKTHDDMKAYYLANLQARAPRAPPARARRSRAVSLSSRARSRPRGSLATSRGCALSCSCSWCCSCSRW